jgi:orotate phosphoribosyltransferase
MNTIPPSSSSFVEFLLRCGALRFGSFTLKSGRKAPYFINAGLFNTGDRISTLGTYYAEKIKEFGWASEVATIFGPAYKGVPLAVATATQLTEMLKRPVGYTFDRKEIKDHGDGGWLVGYPLTAGTPLVLVEDVVTAGTTLHHIIPLLREKTGAVVKGVIVAVDRREKGSSSSRSALDEASEALEVPIKSIVTVHEIMNYVSSPQAGTHQLTPELLEQAHAYLKEYGAP